jgi:hypothetical protein|tara:strand:- start:603 stop:926 length:324 start_codon:yes stop_codon:yes gene_type:complete
MPIDMGTLNINSAGTPEKLSGDLAAQAVVRLNSRIKKILLRAPAGNTGNVFLGILGRDNTTATVSSTYGITLVKGTSQLLEDVNQVFSDFQGDAATTGDDIEWVVWF